MINNIINIFSNDEFIFNTLKNIINKNYAFHINYIHLQKKKKIIINYKNLNIIFIPPVFKVADCAHIKLAINNKNSKKIILCLNRKIGPTFSSFKDNILFLPVSIYDLEKKINEINLSSPVSYGDLVLNRSYNALTNVRNKSHVALTEIESNILIMLIEHPDSMTKKRLNKEVLGHKNDIDSHSLDSHIYRIRKKLKEIDSSLKINVKKAGIYTIS